MRSALLARLILALAILALPSCKQIPSRQSTSRSASQQETRVRVPEMDGVIAQLHRDFKALSVQHRWLSSYDDKCLLSGPTVLRKLTIDYMPEEKKKGPLPQQPDHLRIGYGPIKITKGFKYSNDVEDESACQFPALGARIYARILIRGKENAGLADAIRRFIIKRCEALQEELRKSQAHSIPDQRLRAALSAIIDDIAALKPTHPQLGGFDAAALKRKLDTGFEYKHRITGLKGKSFEFEPNGCWLYVVFRGPNDAVQMKEQKFFQGADVTGYWNCSGSDVSRLKTDIQEILQKRKDQLK